MTEYNKYDVVFGEFPDSDDSCQSGIRPAVIIQNNIGNRFSPTMLVIPMSSKLKKVNQPTHILIHPDHKNGLSTTSMLLAEQTMPISKNKVTKIGRIQDRTMQKDIFKCFLYSSAYGDDDEDLKELKKAQIV